MNFKQWLEQHGCTVEVTQDDDGSGYVCLDVRTAEGGRYDIRVCWHAGEDAPLLAVF